MTVWCRQRRSGVSLLLEALFGLGLIGCVMLIVFGLLPTTYGALGQARRVTEATNLAARQLAVERARPFQDPAPGTLPSALISLPATVDGKPVENVYNVTVSCVNVDVPGSADERQSIVVLVSWTQGPLTRQVRAETLVTRQ